MDPFTMLSNCSYRTDTAASSPNMANGSTDILRMALGTVLLNEEHRSNDGSQLSQIDIDNVRAAKIKVIDFLLQYLQRDDETSQQKAVKTILKIVQKAGDDIDEEFHAFVWRTLFLIMNRMGQGFHFSVRKALDFILYTKQCQKDGGELPYFHEELHQYWKLLYPDPNHGLYVDDLNPNLDEKCHYKRWLDNCPDAEALTRWKNLNVFIAELLRCGLINKNAETYVLTCFERVLRIDTSYEHRMYNQETWLFAALVYLTYCSSIIYPWCLNGRDPFESRIGFDLDRWNGWKGVLTKFVNDGEMSDLLIHITKDTLRRMRKAENDILSADPKKVAGAVQALQAYHYDRAATWISKHEHGQIQDANGLDYSIMPPNSDFPIASTEDVLQFIDTLRNGTRVG